MYIRYSLHDLSNAEKPYKMRGTSHNTLPAPTATDKDGNLLDPKVAVQRRVEAKGQTKHQHSPSPVGIQEDEVSLQRQGHSPCKEEHLV